MEIWKIDKMLEYVVNEYSINGKMYVLSCCNY